MIEIGCIGVSAGLFITVIVIWWLFETIGMGAAALLIGIIWLFRRVEGRAVRGGDEDD